MGVSWLAIIASLSLAAWGAPASAAKKAQIAGLSDLAFTSISFSTDSVQSENVCVYSSSALQNYSITATGGGSGGSFVLTSLSNPSDSLAYQVEWSPSSGQASGTALTAGTPLTGQHSTAPTSCTKGSTSTASLIVIIRAAAVDAAIAEPDYSDTLTLTVAPE